MLTSPMMIKQALEFKSEASCWTSVFLSRTPENAQSAEKDDGR